MQTKRKVEQMAQNVDYKHIKVTAAEEDEIIEAGVVSPEENPVKRRYDDPPDESLPQNGANAPERSGGDPRERHDEPADALEDLESEPMSLTQRIVIIGALILIIVALVYYFIAMR